MFAERLIFKQIPAFFVTRVKTNMKFKRRYAHPVDKETGLGCDQTISLTGFYTRQYYIDVLRRVKFCDANTGKTLVFFQWIKQHLRIKRFYRISENAVKTPIWIKVSAYVLVARMKKSLNLQESLYTILQILSVSTFKKGSLYQIITDSSH